MLQTRNIAIALILLMGISSCSVERRLARQFITSEADLNVLILPPPGLIKNYYPIHPDSIPDDERITFDLEDSRFLQYVEDSLLIRYFVQSLTEELQRFDVKVFTPEQIDTFFQLDTNAFVFSIAQLEVMEYLDEMQDYVIMDTVVFEAGLPITTLVQNNWFEYSEVNRTDRPLMVLFSMQHRSDYIEGRFRRNWLTGEVRYEYRPYRLTLDDVYDLAWFSAQQNAQYIFDWLMNQYIRDNHPRPRETLTYYQYDRFRHTIRRAYNEKFYVFPTTEAAEEEDP
jgi:hypothetical protein